MKKFIAILAVSLTLWVIGFLAVYGAYHTMKDDICTCCGKRPVAGYIGDGVRLDTLCLKCWKKGGQPQDAHNQRKGHGKGGKE